MSRESTPEDLPPDSQISSTASLSYWNNVSSDVSGMLGGYPQVSRIDLQGSKNFLTKLRRIKSNGKNDSSVSVVPQPPAELNHVVDCGAGIGRVTTGFLCHVSRKVDVVEPVAKFAQELSKSQDFKAPDQLDRIFVVGLEDWLAPTSSSDSSLASTDNPESTNLSTIVAESTGESRKYDLIWNQWCLGHLNDSQLKAYLGRCATQALNEGGWIVVKENLSTHSFGEDLYDELDSSVTRTDAKFRQIFEDAGLFVVKAELQSGFPKGLGLYPVKMYALRPK